MALPEASKRFRGVNELHALLDVGLVAFLFLATASFLWMIHIAWAASALLLATLPAALVAAGARYECHIAPSGVTLRCWRAWLVPVMHQRYFTDARFELYEAWESERPEGVFVRSARVHEQDSEPFGPYVSEARMHALCSALNQALTAARAAAPPAPQRLRCPVLADMHEALELAHARRSEAGRLLAITTRAPIHLRGIELPAGTVLHFAGEGFVDPAREDTLEEAECHAPVDLGPRLALGRSNALVTRTGARLRFDEAGRLRAVHSGFAGPVDVDGVRVDGTEPIGFDRDGRLCSYTLAAATHMGGWPIPGGSRVYILESTALLARNKIVWLGGPLGLPEVTLARDDSLSFAAEDRLVGISPRRDIVVHGLRIRHGVMPIPVRADGTVDVAACKRANLVA